MLCMFSDRLVAAVRQEDTVARLGGDEFVIALSELTQVDVANLATKVIKAVSQPYSIEGHDVSMTTSIGISIYPSHGLTVDTLMKNADIALYEAKRAGKNSFRFAKDTDVLEIAHN